MRRDELWNLRAGGYIEPLYPGYNILVRGTDKYVNFGVTVGDSGYGFRDNNGVMEIKDNNGTWSEILSSSEISNSYLKINQTTPQTTVGIFTFPTVVTGDHEATGLVPQVVNVCYGTGEPPDVSTVPEGTIFIKYIG